MYKKERYTNRCIILHVGAQYFYFAFMIPGNFWSSQSTVAFPLVFRAAGGKGLVGRQCLFMQNSFDSREQGKRNVFRKVSTRCVSAIICTFPSHFPNILRQPPNICSRKMLSDTRKSPTWAGLYKFHAISPQRSCHFESSFDL